MNRLLITIALCVSPVFASVSSSVSVGATGGQSQPCSKTRSDNALNVCYWEPTPGTSGRGVAVADTWIAGTLDYVVSGMIGASMPGTATVGVQASSSTTITDFAGQGHNVVVDNHCDAADPGMCQAVDVYLNTSYVTTVSPNGTYTLTYASGTFDIQIKATHSITTAGDDYVGYFYAVELTAP